MRMKLKIVGGFFLLLLFGSGDFQVQGLRVTGKDSPTEAIAGSDVTIPCQLSSVQTPLDLMKVSVLWTHKLHNGTVREVYHFYDSEHTSSRSGCYMNDSKFLHGDASLYIPRVQISDEGEYTCYVIVTPNDGRATSTLHVSVTPQIKMSPRKSIELGIDGSVTCDVSRFYPKDISIQWVRHSKRSGTNSTLQEDVSTIQPVQNEDGTFNLNSLLTVRSSHEAETGDEYFCVVTHRSSKEKIVSSYTMPGVVPLVAIYVFFTILNGVLFTTIYLKPHSIKRWKRCIHVLRVLIFICFLVLCGVLLHFLISNDLMAGEPLVMHLLIAALCLFIILCLILLFSSVKKIGPYFFIRWKLWIHVLRVLTSTAVTGMCFYLLHSVMYFTAGAPLMMYLLIVALCLFIILCLILLLSSVKKIGRYFLFGKPTVSELSGHEHLLDKKQSTINFQITDFKLKEIKINVFLKRWNKKREHIHLWNSAAGDTNTVCNTGLHAVAERDPLFPEEMKVKQTKPCCRMYTCHGSITLIPNVDRDNGAELTVEVIHSTLKWPIKKCRTLRVQREFPVLTPITGEKWIPHMKTATLTCQVLQFIPKEMEINVYLKRRHDLQKKLIHSSVSEEHPLGEEGTAGHQGDDTCGVEETQEVLVHGYKPVEANIIEGKEGHPYCKMYLTLDADTDDGAVLFVEVNHPALELSEWIYRTLHVYKGGKPSWWKRLYYFWKK